MLSFGDVPQMLRTLQPDNPVYCIYPLVYRRTTQRFIEGFPGRVLYAVKANNHPLVLRALLDAGIRDFDCASLVEIKEVRALSQDAVCYLMNPVRIRNAARIAQQEHGVRHFVVDNPSGLEGLTLAQDARPGQAPVCVDNAAVALVALVDNSRGCRPA